MDNTKGQACRAIYWEEMTTEQRVDKLAEAVETLGRSVLELERENALFKQHAHAATGTLTIPFQHDQPEQPWHKRHLLGRAPR